MKAFFRFIGWVWAAPWVLFGPIVVVVYGINDGSDKGVALGMAGFTIVAVLLVVYLWRTRPTSFAGKSTKDDLSL